MYHIAVFVYEHDLTCENVCNEFHNDQQTHDIETLLHTALFYNINILRISHHLVAYYMGVLCIHCWIKETVCEKKTHIKSQ